MVLEMHPEMRITGEGLKLTQAATPWVHETVHRYNITDVKWILADKSQKNFAELH
jgi:hypothetical protein